jgi:uracil-DNA glycosylase
MLEAVAADARLILARLANHPKVGRYVDAGLDIPKPYLGGSKAGVRLVMVGQDPTIRNVAQREKITTVLNLDKSGALRKYAEKLCCGLGVGMSEVYATNACKNFFTEPPTAILARTKIDVLMETSLDWLPLLRAELNQFPDAVVVSLGQPVLTMLVRSGGARAMRHFWGYHSSWQRERVLLPLSCIQAQDSTLDRMVFPFVHQPCAQRSKFYQHRFQDYVIFIRENGLRG